MRAMNAADLARLVLLSAIWGFSFLFMRILSPVLGPVLTTNIRLLIAGLALTAYFFATNVSLEWRKNGKHYLLIGAVNSSLPFVLFSFAALHIPVSYSAVMNATSPLFAAVFSALWLSTPFTRKSLVGLLFGTAGVALVAHVKPAATDAYFVVSLLACLGAAVCYGIAAIYIRKFAAHVPSKSVAAGSQLMAGLLLIPFLPFGPSPGAPTPLVIASMLTLALVCSSFAYLLYYRLIADIGPTRALTVTFLIPVFGMLWGHLFLQEAVSLNMILGSALVIAGTFGITRA